MKVIRPLGLMLAMCALAGAAEAQDTAPASTTTASAETEAPPPSAKGWKIELRVDEQFAATAVLVNALGAGRGAATRGGEGVFAQCRAPQRPSDYRVPMKPPEYDVQADGLLATSPYGLDYGSASFLNSIAELQTAECKRDKSSNNWEKIKVEVVTNAKEFRPPVIIDPGRYEFELEGWAARVLEKLGRLSPDCKAWQRSGVGPEKAVATCSASRPGDKLVFHLDESVREGRVEVGFALPNTTTDSAKIFLDVDICHFIASGDMKVLVQGAAKERLVLVPATNDRGRSCRMKVDEAISVRLGDVTIPVTPTGVDAYGFSAGPALDLHGIPENLPLGLREFELVGSEGVVGLATVEVVGKIVAAPKLAVDYRLRTASIDEIAKLQPYFENASGTSDDGIAIVNPIPEAKPEPSAALRFIVSNTATVLLPTQLPTGARQSWQEITKEEAANRMSFGDGVVSAEYVWVVESNPLGSEVWYEHAVRLEEKVEPPKSPDTKADGAEAPKTSGEKGAEVPAKETLAPQEPAKSAEAAAKSQTWPWRVLVDGAKTITFDVLRQTEREIRPKLALLRVNRTFPMTDTGEVSTKSIATVVETLLEVEVTLASKARRESVPLPIRDLLEITCDRDLARNGHTKAIENEAVRAGECKIGINKDQKAILERALPLFGPQTILVSVEHDGIKAERVWPLRLDSQDVNQNEVLPLPAPSGDKDSTSVYKIEGRIAAQVTGDAYYRGATKEKIRDELTSREQTDLRFTANLRPRGPFGWRVPIRTYVTAFVPLSGFRTPAAPTELRNSQQLTSVQYVTPRAGMLFTLEPFNADKGVNPWPMNPGVQVGMNIVNIADGDFAPTFLLGGALSLPVLEGSASQLGSKVTLGAYYEYDPRVDWQYANHFLLTLGLNIGSLFSGNTK